MWMCYLSIFLKNKHLYLIGVWVGVDQRTNTMTTCVQKRLDYVFKIFPTIPHSTVNTIGMTYAFNEGVNKHALPITTMSEIRLRLISNAIFVDTPSYILLMQHKAPLCNSKIGRTLLKNKSNHTPYLYLTEPKANKKLSYTSIPLFYPT